MKQAGMMESYIINAAGEYEGKVDIFGAISASSSSVLDFVVNEPITLSEDDSLKLAMTKTVDFVGESIPILSADKKYLKAVVSEGSIFQAVIDVQNSVSKIGRA
jgi:hypothetical protein